MKKVKIIKNNKSKYKILAFIVLVCMVAVVIYSASLLLKDSSEYQEVNDTQEQIIDEVVNDSQTESSNNSNNSEFSVDWNKLLSINSDVVAWIYIPDTNINYPVVQGDNDNQYLHKNIYGKYSKGGTIFVEAYNTNPFENVNTIIYGHNLMNSKMFSDLRKYTNKKFFNQHNVVYIYLPNGEVREYKVISFHIVKSNDTKIYNPYVENINDYIDYALKNNKLSTSYTSSANDKIITLSTCTNRDDTDRYVLHAVYTDVNDAES